MNLKQHLLKKQKALWVEVLDSQKYPHNTETTKFEIATW